MSLNSGKKWAVIESIDSKILGVRVFDLRTEAIAMAASLAKENGACEEDIDSLLIKGGHGNFCRSNDYRVTLLEVTNEN